MTLFLIALCISDVDAKLIESSIIQDTTQYEAKPYNSNDSTGIMNIPVSDMDTTFNQNCNKTDYRYYDKPIKKDSVAVDNSENKIKVDNKMPIKVPFYVDIAVYIGLGALALLLVF